MHALTPAVVDLACSNSKFTDAKLPLHVDHILTNLESPDTVVDYCISNQCTPILSEVVHALLSSSLNAAKQIRAAARRVWSAYNAPLDEDVGAESDYERPACTKDYTSTTCLFGHEQAFLGTAVFEEARRQRAVQGVPDYIPNYFE